MMTTTLADLRRLLEGGLTRGGPAIDRLPEPTVEAMVTAYLPRSLSALDGGRALHYHAVHMLLWWSGDERLDLTDSGTAHALLVAHALYRGFDPGAMGLGVAMVLFGDGWYLFGERPNGAGPGLSKIAGAAVAAEPNPIRALALAVAHVLP